MKIENRVYVVAEAGINHNGKYEIAKRLVDIAVDARCSAVKFQTFRGMKDLPFKNLSFEQTYRISEYCRSKDILFFSTPYTKESVDFLESLLPFYKIASSQIVVDDFVKFVAQKNKPIIASVGSKKNRTGVATYDEIEHFLSLVNRDKLILLYCISKYPYDSFSAKSFKKFKKTYPEIHVGFSCHSKNIKCSLQAAENGACLVEQHITIDNDFECPDKSVSLNPESLKQLVKEIKAVER